MHNEFSERRFDDFLQLKYAKEIVESEKGLEKYYKCFCFSVMFGLLNELKKFIFDHVEQNGGSEIVKNIFEAKNIHHI